MRKWVKIRSAPSPIAPHIVELWQCPEGASCILFNESRIRSGMPSESAIPTADHTPAGVDYVTRPYSLRWALEVFRKLRDRGF